MDVDFEELAIFLETLERSGFSHFVYEKGDVRIEVSTQPITHVPTAAPTVTIASPMIAATALPSVVIPSAPAPAASFDRQPNDVDVKAPLLGSVYFSPKPGEPRFVEIGSQVTAGSPLCIIEVMKLMNSVEAPIDGTVVAAHFADGELVEFGQAIFTIRPNGN
jgi:acetyl-CoA carboxylase biotin carboxyl carrier protein